MEVEYRNGLVDMAYMQNVVAAVQNIKCSISVLGFDPELLPRPRSAANASAESPH
jgi:hypothetical protein